MFILFYIAEGLDLTLAHLKLIFTEAGECTEQCFNFLWDAVLMLIFTGMQNT